MLQKALHKTFIVILYIHPYYENIYNNTMKKTTLLSLITLVLLAVIAQSCGESTESEEEPHNTLQVKMDETKIHEYSGLQVNVGISNMAAVIAGFRWLFTKEESERKAKDAYDLAAGMGLDNVLSVTATFPDGQTKNIDLDGTPFCFEGGIQTFVGRIVKVDRSSGEVTLRIDESDEDCPEEISTTSNYEVRDEPIIIREKYQIEESYLRVGSTFNDKETGLFLYIREINEENQTIIADYRTPDLDSKIENASLEAAHPYDFIYDGRKFKFKVKAIRSITCDVEVREE